jgi:predicted small metal-binding protein
MEKLLRCDCGYEVHAEDDEALVARAREHARTAHRMEFTPEQLLRLATRTESHESERSP